MLTEAVCEQLLPSVPVTVYVRLPTVAAVKTGAAMLLELKSVPGDHKYVTAPAAVSVVISPSQRDVGTLGVTVKTGSAFTVTVTDAELEQPLPSVPRTV